MDKELIELAQIAFEAEFPDTQVAEMDKQAEEWGVARRIMLITMARSRDQLLDGFRDHPGSIMDAYDGLQSYEKHLKAALEMVGAAQLRMLAVAAAIHLEGAK